MLPNEKLLQVIHIQTELAKLGLDLGAVMQFVVERTLPLIDADGAVIELAEKQDMVYRAASGIAVGALGLRLKIASSLSGLCVQSGNVLSCADSETDPRVDRSACRQLGLRSMIVLPLTHLGKTIGVLKALSSHTNKFGDDEIYLLTLLTEMIAAVMYLAEKYDHDALFIKATHDEMTGLANKAFFMDKLRTTVAKSQQAHHLSAIVICDMDGLKQINDNFGHRVGDAALQEFANRMKVIARNSDTAARLGGDEFGLILSPIKSSIDVETSIGHLETELTTPLSFENKQIPLNASIGSALIPEDSVELDNLLDLADARMYTAKRARYSLQRREIRNS